VKKKRGPSKSFASCPEITFVCLSFFRKVLHHPVPQQKLLPANLSLMAGELGPQVARQMQDGPEDHMLHLLVVVGDIGGATLIHHL
jgi:hypothetical protein